MDDSLARFAQKLEEDVRRQRAETCAQLRPLIDECLDASERKRAAAFTHGERTKVHEFAAHNFEPLWQAIRTKSWEQREPLVEEFIRIALFEAGRPYPVPKIIIRELFANVPDDELCGVLYQTIASWFSQGGAYSARAPWRVADLFDRLPRGLQVVYTLTNLESLTYNGGISYAITSFADGRPDIDRFPNETYDDCRLVGAVKKAALYKKAVELVKQSAAALKRLKAVEDEKRAALEEICEAKFQKKFDRLDGAYYTLEESEGMYDLIDRYLQRHPEDFVFGKKTRKCQR